MLILIFSFFVGDVAADVAIRHLMSGDIIYLIPRTHRYDVMVWYMVVTIYVSRNSPVMQSPSRSNKRAPPPPPPAARPVTGNVDTHEIGKGEMIL